MSNKLLLLALLFALLPTIAFGKEKKDAKLEVNLKAEKVPLKTDDNVIEREEQKMSHDGYSVHEKKMLKPEKHAFQAEVSKLMGLIINSLYSQKDIFLREVISNASDALDKIRFLSLTDPKQLGEGDQAQLDIRIRADEATKTLYITDKGIGMTHDELVKNLGTIAHSGTREFFEKLASGGDMSLIGQFGVGFYSTFLVADKVTVTTKHNNDKQYVWQSDAHGEFTVGEDPEGNTLGRGTQIALHLKEDALEYLKQDALKNLVAKYSEFINFPIYLWVSREEERPVKKAETEAETKEETEKKEEDVKVEEGEEDEDDDDEDEDTEWVKVFDWVLLNDNKPLWTRKPSDVTEEEYKKFYKAFSKDNEDPLAYVHFNAEGDVEFKCVIFVPTKAPSGMFDTTAKVKAGLKLYVRRVFITDDFESIVPKYLSFIKGVIDSDSLPLNVSREVLQKNQMISIMNKKIVRKIISMIQELAESKPEAYKTFWKEYSTSIKLGIIEDSHNRSRLSKLLRFHSSKTSDPTSLDDYVSRMKEGQKQIYYIATESKEAAEQSPLAEKLLKRGYEVLYMVDPIDEYTLQSLDKFDNKFPLTNIAKEGLAFDDKISEAELKELQDEYKPLTDWLKKTLSSKIEKAVITNRLTRTPSALVAGTYGWTANMERLVRAQALTDSKMASLYKPKKILELNPKHPIVAELKRRVNDNPDDAVAKEIAELTFDTAALQGGFALEDPANFASRINRMLKKSLNLDPSLEVEEEPEEEETKTEKKEEKKEEKEKEEKEKDEL